MGCDQLLCTDSLLYILPVVSVAVHESKVIILASVQ